MKIDLKNLLSGGEEKVAINCSLHFDDLIYGDYFPIKQDVKVVGSAYSKADVAYLDVDISFVFEGVCDRCAEPIVRPMTFHLSKILVDILQNEDDETDEYLIVKNDEIDLDELVREEIILFLPSKMLCKEDCKGLCPKCGKNLNIGNCDCKKDVDPRMASLLQLLDEE